VRKIIGIFFTTFFSISPLKRPTKNTNILQHSGRICLLTTLTHLQVKREILKQKNKIHKREKSKNNKKKQKG